MLVSIIVIALIISNRPKSIEQEMTYYQLRFPTIFQEVKDDNSGYVQEMPELEEQENYFQAKNSRFVAQMPAKTYQEPFVYERKGQTLSIIPETPDSKKSPAVVHKQDNTNYLLYEDAYESTDIIKKVIPSGIKEYIMLKSDQAPDKFEWTLNVSDDVTAIKESDGD